ncbi:MAG: DUF2634 domain-containing protein [Bacillota bacterium]
MALTPQQADNLYVPENNQLEVKPSKTYRLDFTTFEITDEKVGGEAALRQFIEKSLRTPRFRYLIYSSDYGSELMNLIGDDVTQEYLNAEIPRMVKESLIFDDRIEDIQNIKFFKELDTVFITFTVLSSEGFLFSQEVSV